jgi:hypothetical protein
MIQLRSRTYPLGRIIACDSARQPIHLFQSAEQARHTVGRKKREGSRLNGVLPD